MNNIDDCISQIWWGHRIQHGTIKKAMFMGHDEDDVRKFYELDARTLTQDNDVLDTWFSSSLRAFCNLRLPENKEDRRFSHKPVGNLIRYYIFWLPV